MEEAFVERWASNCREWKREHGQEEVLERVKELPLDERVRIAIKLREGIDG